MPLTNLPEEVLKRFEEITKMALELASGNFLYRLERTERDDELEALVVGLNMMVEELNYRFNRGYLNLEYTNIIGMAFVVDHNLIIESIDTGVQRTLLFSIDEMKGKPLQHFVTIESKLQLDELQSRLLNQEEYPRTVDLFFKMKESFIVPTYCSVSALNDAQHATRFLVLAIETVAQEKTAREESRDLHEAYAGMPDNTPAYPLRKRSAYFREDDFQKVQQVQSMIQDLQVQWSLSILADTVRMEKRTLTKMFKKCYGKSIMAFILDERMRKAQELLKDPGMQLKEIAYAIGYKNLSTFSQIFKKQFGCSPTEYRQNLPGEAH